MAEPTHWAFPRELQPKAGEVGFDLAAAFDAVVALRVAIPEDAFTAPILGTERTGNGVVIRGDGLVLTVGYLILEAESIWLTANNGVVVAGHPLAYDFVTGFGLVQPLGHLDLPPLAIGSSAAIDVGDEVIVLGHGGRAHALKADVFAKREFAGPWEYVLDEALFTTPAHPEWSGAALLDEDGRLIGIGSLLLQEKAGEETVDGNMFVPIDLLEPILEPMVTTGRSPHPPRPWLGMSTQDPQGKLVVSKLSPGSPAQRAGVRVGDMVLGVGTQRVHGLAELFRAVWQIGAAGVEVPLMLSRGGDVLHITVKSADRSDFLKKPNLH
jgi:S1-C subfamily serine protease